MKRYKLLIILLTFLIVLFYPNKIEAKTYKLSELYDYSILKPGDIIDFNEDLKEDDEPYITDKDNRYYLYLNDEKISDKCFGLGNSCLKQYKVINRMIFVKSELFYEKDSIIYNYYKLDFYKLEDEEVLHRFQALGANNQSRKTEYYKSGDLFLFTHFLDGYTTYYVYNEKGDLIKSENFDESKASVYRLPQINGKDVSYKCEYLPSILNGLNEPHFVPLEYKESKLNFNIDKYIVLPIIIIVITGLMSVIVENKQINIKKLFVPSIFIIVILYVFLYVYNNDYHMDNGVPVIDIELKDISLNTVHKDKTIKYKDNKLKLLDDNKTILNETMTFKGRGNYSWALAKKSYGVTFDDKISLLSLPKIKKYVLLGNQTDNSLLKNDFTYSVAKKMDLNYSFTGEFVDVYIDKNYIGNYYLTPKIDISKNVVNLKNDNALIVELDNAYYKEEKNYFETKYLKDFFVLKESNSKDTSNFKVFENKYNEMEKCLLKKDYKCLEKKIDIDSFVKYYILAEFAENSDSLRSSVYMYTDGDNDKIHMGPVWDFDVAYGLKPQNDIYDDFLIKKGLFKGLDKSELFYHLMQIKEFENKVIFYWNTTAREIYKEEIDNLDNKIEYLKKAGTYNNYYWGYNDFEESASKFKSWVTNRYNYINTMVRND